jgi:hypothetical protein
MKNKTTKLLVVKDIGFTTKTRCGGCHQLIEGNSGRRYICWHFRHHFSDGDFNPKRLKECREAEVK